VYSLDGKLLTAEPAANPAGGNMSYDDACPCENCGVRVEYRHGLCQSCYARAKEDERNERMDEKHEAWRDGE